MFLFLTDNKQNKQNKTMMGPWFGDEDRMEIDEVVPHADQRGRGRKRFADSVWQVRQLRASLPTFSSQTAEQTTNIKRQKHRPFVSVKTVSGVVIQVEPFREESFAMSLRPITIADIKRSLSEDHGLSCESSNLLLNGKIVTFQDTQIVDSGTTLHLILRIGLSCKQVPCCRS